MSQPPSTESAAGARSALSRELSEFLIELSIGVHRFAMYPGDHPSLGPAVDAVMDRLDGFFAGQERLAIGVAGEQLVIEGVATDRRHPVLSDLARRLHEHQIGALSLTRGASAPEVRELLRELAADPERAGEPMGLLPPEERPHWPHVAVHPIGYEKLATLEEGEEGLRGDRAVQLWLGLAQSALGEESLPAGSAPDGAAVAEAIAAEGRDAAYDQVVVGYLRQLAEELKGADSREDRVVRERVSGLLRRLDDRTLGRLLAMSGQGIERKRFVLDANQSLAVDAVVKVARAAAASSGRTISDSLSRLLAKLAVHAEEGGQAVRAQADQALRAHVSELVEGWELEDPNPQAYSTILDSMARATPLFEERLVREDDLAGSERLVRMALEAGAFGPSVERAVGELLDRGQAPQLLELLDAADPDSEGARRVERILTEPDGFKRILSSDDVDDALLTALVDRMGETALDPLFDVLADSDSLAVRRKVFEVLAGWGPPVAERAVARLDDPRWFVLRNTLSLLQRVETLPPGFDAGAFMDHPDHRVRREAFPLAVADPAQRERTLVTALQSTDERLVRMALLELRDRVPEALVPTVVNRALRSDHSSDLRALAARVLRGSRSGLALEALLEVVTDGRSLFGKPRLGEKSPERLEALSSLAHGWPGHERVAPLLAHAARSRDAEVRAAVTRGSDS